MTFVASGVEEQPRSSTKPIRRRVLFVLGMHRSGTSAIAGALVRLGLPMAGADEPWPTDRHNPRGYFESVSTVQANDLILQALGGTWRRPPSTCCPAVGPVAEAFAEPMARLARRLLPDGTQLAVWKDPRFCLTLPLWRRIVEAPCAVLVVRHPLEVARSLAAREGIPIDYGLALFYHYLRRANEALEGMPVALVRYEELLCDVDLGVRRLGELTDRLAELVDAAPLRGAHAAARALIDPALRHQRAALPSCTDDHDDPTTSAQADTTRATSGPRGHLAARTDLDTALDATLALLSALGTPERVEESWQRLELPPPGVWAELALAAHPDIR
jgi:hypothetical protein